ncbi:TlpA family protein disulfide reductase [Muricauda sp. SCSIO 64092]|uniref:TlpA family protein disulfide reductase n=1 Tax=Allomuricauda sp. SCSIO 64092 TaxID=2908842 RepID=UPI001FF6DA1E|nr:TlpA disulfide reductase family protein [Muricauda sp. SCSIO 64092]UOY08681.1 TlpA family protein disulfide reductase [Muricauda sp. SCSIO 64092]
MKPRFPFLRKIGWSDWAFGLFVVLLIIPQTRKPIQVGINRLKVAIWSPGVHTTKEADSVAAFTYSLRDLEGKEATRRIGDGRITFLSFWATWCAPCIAELPSIEALYQDYGDAVDFVLVTYENPEVVQRFLSKKGIQLPVFHPLTEVPEVLQSSSLPTNYIIDAEGNILIKEKGAANWNSKKVRGLLDGLIKQP